MTATNDGFKIAEVDLDIRGPGNIEGTRQSGLPELKIANIVQDRQLLEQARQFAIAILTADSTLEKEENGLLKRYMDQYKKGRVGWEHIS